VTDLNDHRVYVTKLKEREECIINLYNAARKNNAAVSRNVITDQRTVLGTHEFVSCCLYVAVPKRLRRGFPDSRGFPDTAPAFGSRAAVSASNSTYSVEKLEGRICVCTYYKSEEMLKKRMRDRPKIPSLTLQCTCNIRNANIQEGKVCDITT